MPSDFAPIDYTTTPTVPQPPVPQAGFGETPWWKDYKYSGAYDPSAELAMTVNSLLPTMSPIDRRYWSSWLYQQDPAKFVSYKPGTIADYGTEGDVATQGSYASADRAKDAWKRISDTILGTGTPETTDDKKVEDMGAALPWLQRVLDTTARYAPGASAGTGAGRRTRAQERAMQSDLTGLWSEAQSSQDLQPYLELAKRFVMPSLDKAPISTPTPMGTREGAYNPASYQSYSKSGFVSNPRFI